MKKLSFLELEKEMETLSEEEASRTKGGGPPSKDCAFQAFYHIMTHYYGMGGATEQQLEDYYNNYRNSNDGNPKVYTDYADVTGLQGINKSDKGLGWINTCLSNHYDDGVTTFSASYASGNSAIPNTTDPGENNQYMLIIQDEDGTTHAAAFLGMDSVGNYLTAEPQLGDGYTKVYNPNEIIGSVIFHKQPTTTVPSTSVPTTII